MSQAFDISKPNRPIRVGVILMGGETEILDLAPVDLINGMSKEVVAHLQSLSPDLQPQALDMEFHWVSEAGESKPARCTAGIRILPTDSFETCPPLDIVLMGAHYATYTPNAAELAFVRKSWEDCSAFIAICAGFIPAMMAGVLEGKTATGPRVMLDQLRRDAPSTDWVEKRWVRDGKLWTSGALTNGLDLVHNFAKHYWGSADETIPGFLSKLGAWPDRDVDYKDVPWRL